MSAPPGRVLVFTGHRIDAADRPHPRFPEGLADAALAAIALAVAEQCREHGWVRAGVAAGASGGDLLFHQTLAEAKIPSLLCLPLPRDEFVAASVAPAGPAWVALFDDIHQRADVRTMTPGDRTTVWQRGNEWMLAEAFALADAGVTLLALWDGRSGDGPGGTEAMVQSARRRGAEVVIIDPARLGDTGQADC